jgi:hypothetical protein
MTAATCSGPRLAGVEGATYPLTVFDGESVASPMKPTQPPQAVPLHMFNRAVAVILGLTGVGSGGVAVFATPSEAGPAALIAGGLTAPIIDVGGRMPASLKIGDNEVTWEKALRRLEDQTPRSRISSRRRA